MKAIFSALISGMIFGLGIAISGMGNPAKVLNFFDPFGTWGPSLALVMGGALITTAIGYRLVFRHCRAPLFEPRFDLPNARTIDARPIGGSALFGLGWGIAGFRPGDAIPALAIPPWPTALFLIAMGAGMLTAQGLRTARLPALLRRTAP